MKKVKRVCLGDKVFAKVKGYPAWPARVDEDLGKKYKVYFYGTGETGTVKAEDLFSYVEHKDQFVKSLKRKDYNDAIEEIEAAIAQDGLNMDEREEEEAAEIEREEEIKRGLKRKLSVDSTSGAEAKRKNVPARTTESKKLNVSAPSKASAKVSEALESEASEGRKSPESVLSDDENDELERSNNNKIEIRRDSEKHDSSSDEEMENELLQGKRALESKPTKFKVVTPHALREICAEFEEAVKDAEKGNEKPDEDSYIPQNEVLLSRIKADKYIGIKLNRNKPDETFETEVERLRWKESDARTALELKEKIEEGSLKPEDKPELFEFDLELTDEQLKDAARDRIMERKRTKLKFLKVEATLVELDASIKTNLALDKADPKEALKGLDVMLNLKIEPLMLKKHSHVMEMVKRLRRYIGNVKEWKLQGKELEDFKKDAELIRAKADTIYSKFRALFTVPEDKTFWEVFNDECEKFKLLTKDMPENQMFILCADPGSHQAILDELDDQEELKLLSDKKENKIQDKENLSQVMNSDETIADLSAENSHTSTDSHG